MPTTVVDLDVLASKKVLNSVDLLPLILSHVSREDAAHAGLVCQGWLDFARDMIWETVTKPVQLFSLLAPLEIAPTSEQRFTREPSQHDWQRFTAFSRRVRHFHIILQNGDYTDVLRAIESSMPFGQDLLPRLTNLFYQDYNHGEATYGLDFMRLFLAPSLRSLHMSTPYGVSGADIGTFFDGMALKCPALQELTLRVSLDVQCLDMEPGLQRLFRTSPLRIMDLPLYFFTPSLLSAAIQCPTMVAVRIEKSVIEPWLSRANLQPCVGFPKVMNARPAVAAIQTMILALPFAELNIIFSRGLLPQLRVLSIRAIGITARPTAAELCAILPESCTSLETVKLDMRSPSRTPNRWEPPPETYAISIEDLSPLVHLKGLTCLGIAHTYPIKVTDAELVTFVGSLPQLETLNLNDCPTVRDVAPALTIDCLPALAQVLPRLKTLGLFFDAFTKDAYEPARRSFKSLKLARFNRSPVDPDKCREIALYLSTVLTDDTKLYTVRKEIQFDVYMLPCPASRDWNLEIDRYFSVIMESRRWMREARIV